MQNNNGEFFKTIFIEYVKELNNEEINNILDESIKVKEIILKYYDENGVWKM